MAKKGNSGTFGIGRTPVGRPKGVPNKATVEIRETARRLLADPEYQRLLVERLRTGQAPTIEALLYHYAHGKPKETIEHQVPMRPVVIDQLQPGEGLKTDDE